MAQKKLRQEERKERAEEKRREVEERKAQRSAAKEHRDAEAAALKLKRAEEEGIRVQQDERRSELNREIEKSTVFPRTRRSRHRRPTAPSASSIF